MITKAEWQGLALGATVQQEGEGEYYRLTGRCDTADCTAAKGTCTFAYFDRVSDGQRFEAEWVEGVYMLVDPAKIPAPPKPLAVPKYGDTFRLLRDLTEVSTSLKKGLVMSVTGVNANFATMTFSLGGGCERRDINLKRYWMKGLVEPVDRKLSKWWTLKGLERFRQNTKVHVAVPSTPALKRDDATGHEGSNFRCTTKGEQYVASMVDVRTCFAYVVDDVRRMIEHLARRGADLSKASVKVQFVHNTNSHPTKAVVEGLREIGCRLVARMWGTEPLGVESAPHKDNPAMEIITVEVPTCAIGAPWAIHATLELLRIGYHIGGYQLQEECLPMLRTAEGVGEILKATSNIPTGEMAAAGALLGEYVMDGAPTPNMEEVAKAWHMSDAGWAAHSNGNKDTFGYEAARIAAVERGAPAPRPAY